MRIPNASTIDPDVDWEKASTASSEDFSVVCDDEVKDAKHEEEAARVFELIDYEPDAFEHLLGDREIHMLQVNDDSEFAKHVKEIRESYLKYASMTIEAAPSIAAAKSIARRITPGRVIAAGLAGVELAVNPVGAVATAAREVIRRPGLVDTPYHIATETMAQAVTMDPRRQLDAFVQSFNTPGRRDLLQSKTRAQVAVLRDLQDELLAVSRWSRCGDQKDWQEAMTILTKQAEILSFPESLHPLAPECDFDKLAETFGRDKKTQVQTELTRIRKNADPKVPDEECVRAQFWIHGAPGVGKTRFAKLLAEETNLPVITISNETDSVEAMFSAPLPGHRWEDPVSGDKHLGILLHAIVRSGCKNPIIVMDEFDDFFAANATRLKDYTNKDNRQLKGPGETTMVFSRCTLIVIGNKPPTDGALAERYTQIHKDYVSREDKSRIAEKQLQELVSQIARRNEPLANGIKAVAIDLLPFIVDENEKRRIPGVRTMNDVIAMVVEQLELHGNDVEREVGRGAGNRTSDRLKNEIRDRFNAQHGKPNQESPYQGRPVPAKSRIPIRVGPRTTATR